MPLPYSLIGAAVSATYIYICAAKQKIFLSINQTLHREDRDRVASANYFKDETQDCLAGFLHNWEYISPSYPVYCVKGTG